MVECTCLEGHSGRAVELDCSVELKGQVYRASAGAYYHWDVSLKGKLALVSWDFLDWLTP